MQQLLDKVQELEHRVSEALALAQSRSRSPKNAHDDLDDDIAAGLERASSEVQSLKLILVSQTQQNSRILSMVANLISAYYTSPWLSVDLPTSVNPFTIWSRPAELLYSIMAYLTFYSEAYLWSFGCMVIAFLTSYQTTQLRHCIANERLPPSIVSVVGLITFRLLLIQLCIYGIKQIEPSWMRNYVESMINNSGSSSHVSAATTATNATFWTWRHFSRYYSTTSATLLAVIVGVCIGF